MLGGKVISGCEARALNRVQAPDGRTPRLIPEVELANFSWQ